MEVSSGHRTFVTPKHHSCYAHHADEAKRVTQTARNPASNRLHAHPIQKHMRNRHENRGSWNQIPYHTHVQYPQVPGENRLRNARENAYMQQRAADPYMPKKECHNQSLPETSTGRYDNDSQHTKIELASTESPVDQAIHYQQKHHRDRKS